MENTQIPEKSRRDLSLFKNAINDMIATSDANSYKDYTYSKNYRGYTSQYTEEEVAEIIASGDPSSMSLLSRYYFYSSGFYRRIIFYYAYLLTYAYVVIPHLKDKPNNKSKKNYYEALDFCEGVGLKSFCEHAAVCVLVDGAYYGLLVDNGGQVSTMDLPFSYCRTRFKGFSGLDIVEINLSYFTMITDSISREKALNLYPKDVKKAYQKYISGTSRGGSQWCPLPEGVGIYLQIHENRPLFINTIPAINNFSTYRDLEIQKEELETKKILVQEIPVDKEGELIFEPEEAKELHRGAVQMLADNTTLDVLTTYAKVDVKSLADSRQTINTNLETFQNMIYAESGASSNIFAATGNISLDQSLKNDLSLMMNLADQFSQLFTYLLNTEIAKGTTTYSVAILPVSYYNTKDYIDQTHKLATTGYSYLLPAIASGLTQKEFLDIKVLENDILGLKDVLIPLSTAFTESDEGGRNPLPNDKKTDKTIKNEEA